MILSSPSALQVGKLSPNKALEPAQCRSCLGLGPGLKSRPPMKLPALPPHCALHKLFHVSRKGEFINLATFWNNRAINGHD